jgi:DNA-binding CsgD family transcriptional regulator
MAEGTVLADPAIASISAGGSSIALLVVDDEGTVAEASLAACRILGVGRQDIVGQAFTDALTLDSADRFERVWDAFHETGGHAGPFELAPPSDAPIDLTVTAAVVPGRHLVLLSRSDPPAPSAEAPPGPVPRAGGRGPTARERQILAMLATGDTDVQIAGKLNLSPATVQTHVRNVKGKLGARTRAQAVAMAVRSGLISDS